MFRVKESDTEVRFSLVASILLLVQLLALLVNLGSFLSVLWVFHMLDSEVRGVRPLAGPAVRSLREVVSLQIVFTVIVSLIQVLGIFAFLQSRHRYLDTRRSVQRVKLLAHNILASLDQGVVTTDQDSVITSINSAAIRMLGVDFECVGRPVACLSTDEVPLADLARRVADRHEPVRDLEFTQHRPDGARRLLANVLELKDAQGRSLGAVIHVRDVTERMLMKEQVWRMEQFNSLSLLASGLHHEIKNPLTALSIHVQLLEEHLRAGDEGGPVRAMLGVIKAEVRRLNGILESFRNFANLQHLAVKPTDVVGLLEDVARLIGPQAEQQRVRLVLERPAADLPRAALDPEKIEQAVLNLVLNALDAMPGGGDLTLGASATDGRVELVVRDTGPGIAPDVREHIFRPYFSTKSEGTGMGLALAEKLVRQHGGRIDFQTGRGGTTFRIAVPLNGKEDRAA
jgi:PAS domain S-box-containing protein